MMRTLWLTLRIHRFEVLFAALLMGVTLVSALVAWQHVTAVDPGTACWATHWDEGPDSSACARAIEQFWPAQDEIGFVASPVGVALPFVVGLLLGVPIVGRELEARTTVLAWSLTGRRSRWLLARLWPMALLAFVGLAVVAFVILLAANAAHPWNYRGPGRIPSLTELGSEGLPLLGRGVLAFGVGTLLGAVVGRTLPAVAIGAVLVIAFLFGGAPLIQGVVGEGVATWVPQESDSDDGGPPTLGYWGTRFRDADGTLLRYEQAEARMRDECPRCPTDDNGWVYQHFTEVIRVTSIDAYPQFEAVESAITVTLGAACLLLTFPVVSRRRPT